MSDNVVAFARAGKIATPSPDDWRWLILSEALMSILDTHDLKHARQIAAEALITATDRGVV
jgi:hypothetical protein